MIITIFFSRLSFLTFFLFFLDDLVVFDQLFFVCMFAFVIVFKCYDFFYLCLPLLLFLTRFSDVYCLPGLNYCMQRK